MVPKPGEIYWAYVEGSPPRPVVVVSREILNRGNYIVAVQFTSSKYSSRRSLPNCVPFRAGMFGLEKNCVAQAESIPLVDKGDLNLEAGALGTLDTETMRTMVRAIGYVIEADCEPE